MEFSPATEAQLSELDSFSAGHIVHRTDLGILLDSGRDQPAREILEELCFYAKFLHRTYGIMARIGPDGEGYARLSAEFADAAGKTRNLMASLLAVAPRGVRERLTATYLPMTQEGLAELLSICRDLGWYKNWLIDTKRQRKGGT